MQVTTDSLSKAIEAKLTQDALPGELEGFRETDRAMAAAFVARVAEMRPPRQPQVLMQSYQHGDRRQMRLAVVNDDMPFLVDSIASVIAARDLIVHRILHPVIRLTRDADGRVTHVGEGEPESLIYVEIERAESRVRNGLVADIRQALRDVTSAVADWRRMQAAMLEDADRMDCGDGADLVRWFAQDYLTILGHEVWYPDGQSAESLGIFRNPTDCAILAEPSRRLAVEWFENCGASPLLLKSNCVSTVHRRVPLDLVIVPVMRGGQPVGLSLYAGLWTSSALNMPADQVPVLRERLGNLQSTFGFNPRGHSGKGLVHALNTLPNDLTTAFPSDALEELALTAISIADRPRPKLVLTESPLGRHLFAFVWMPRDEVSTRRRVAIGEMLEEAAGARLLSWSMSLEDAPVALVRYMFDVRGGGAKPDARALDRRIEKMVRGWVPAVEAALGELAGDRATRLALRYAGAFPAAYRAAYTPEDAAQDIVRLAALTGPDDRSVRITAVAGRPGVFQLKLYRLGGATALSDAVPTLENFGFRVMEEVPTRLDDGAEAFIHDFLVCLSPDVGDWLAEDSAEVEEAIASVIENRAENDGFNRLIVEAAMKPLSVVLLRAWFRYLRQTGISYGLSTVVDALRRAPEAARALIERFAAAHDPSCANGREAAIARADRAIADGLDAVSAIDDDRILRAFAGVVRATLRTNAYAPAANEALAFKLDSSQVPGLPHPLPWREIFVYSPRVEGIHLRAGPVARGGIRWSDRRDDFRTEVLGLMKAQRVKNAVIVPTGAKGGFYPKQLPSPADRDAWIAEGTEAYRIFIRALLSLTDNIVAGAVVHPECVTIHDGEDPYFVVAADKGTATFSDIANAIALDHGFWLGDAFASGGSNGYDHKAMGITARGAWISVQRHFREMGVDVQADPVTVIGCGDMSGDVFGNGMLLSKTLRLQAAFDHRHIFLDPDPDPAASWEERNRLFALPRSSWAEYDKALISKGGGVFARTEKTIPLSAQVKAMLGVQADTLDPTQLISAILKAPADLLWFGGIGTYVKARGQNNAEVGDPANDRLRVDGEDLRVRVVGEGANLGVTQAARIAFAARGGRINTDFIDNSAGVDCSDNEVNIKIGLNREMVEGELSLEARNKLLARMTEDVAALVLEDNRLQTLALSFMENDGALTLPSYVRVIEILEASGRLDREAEGLAPNADLLRRAREGGGLTRPELAVLLATAKLAMQDAIEQAGLGDGPEMEEELFRSFPKPMRAKYPDAIRTHRLRNDIVATEIANRIVNRLGVLHPFELAEEEGVALGRVAAMFVAAERLFGLPDLWERIETADIGEQARLALLDDVALAVRGHVADLLRVCRSGEQPGATIARLEGGIGSLGRKAKQLLFDEARAQSGRISARLVEAGAPEDLAHRVVRLYELEGAVGLVDLAIDLDVDETVLTRAFAHMGEVLGLDWAQASAARIETSDPWERLLLAGLSRDFQQLRLQFLRAVDGADPVASVDQWLADNDARVSQFVALVARARRDVAPNAAMLAQIASQARVLLVR